MLNKGFFYEAVDLLEQGIAANIDTLAELAYEAGKAYKSTGLNDRILAFRRR
tara:strand:+ start:528 stop:683 length:156 start_codon:yes stop_codon:yes gene_type:complete